MTGPIRSTPATRELKARPIRSGEGSGANKRPIHWVAVGKAGCDGRAWVALFGSAIALGGCVYGYGTMVQASTTARPRARIATYYCYDCHGYRYFDPYYDYCVGNGYRYRWSDQPRVVALYRERYVRIKETHPDYGRYRYRAGLPLLLPLPRGQATTRTAPRRRSPQPKRRPAQRGAGTNREKPGSAGYEGRKATSPRSPATQGRDAPPGG